VSMRGIQIWEAIQLCSTSEEGNGALRSSDWVVIDRKQVWASEARWSDVHEGSRAHDLGVGEAQFGRAAESMTRDHPGRGSGR